jgi:UPF0148 protein
MSNNSPNNVKLMAEMLRNGATMLDDYCPKCNNILFRLKNQQIFCSNCNLEVKYAKDVESSKKNEKALESSSEMYFGDLVNIYTKLFIRLTEEIQSIKDTTIIEKYLDNLHKLLDLIKKLRELK